MFSCLNHYELLQPFCFQELVFLAIAVLFYILDIRLPLICSLVFRLQIEGLTIVFERIIGSMDITELEENLFAISDAKVWLLYIFEAEPCG